MTIGEFQFVLPATATPNEIRDAIKAEVNHRLGGVQTEGFSTKRMEAEKRGEKNAYTSIIWFLDHLEFK